MRGYASVIFFCAVLTFVSSAAPNAAENAAEYRAPATGAKLGPVPSAPQAPPLQPAPPTQQGGQGQQIPQGMSSAAAQAAGQAASPAQVAASPQAGAASAAGGPAPWPSGGMMPYSSIGGLPAPGTAADTSTIPAAQAPNTAAMPGSPAAPGYEPGYNPGYAPGAVPPPAPNYEPGYAPYPSAPYPPATYPSGPYPSAPYSGAQGGDVVYGTGQLQGENYNDRGIATQYRDPQTGDIITSVVPPAPPEQQNYGTFFVAPQIYPDGNHWGGNPYAPMPRPGQPFMQPPVTWQPPPPDHNRHRQPEHRHSDGRPDDRRHDDRYDGRYNGPPPAPYPGQHSGQYPGQYPGQNPGQYPGQHSGQHDPRSGDRYDSRPGQQGNLPYDPRDADRSRDGRERR